MLLPKIKEFLGQIEAINKARELSGFRLNQTNVREAMAITALFYMTESDRTVTTVDEVIVNNNYPVPVRIYIPKMGNTASFPVALYFHGGGHVAGGISIYDGIVRKLSNCIKHIIISVEYRLAPEFAYPVGINDCKKVIENSFSILDKRKISYKNKDIVLIGDSAGGAIIASITADQEYVKKSNIKKQVLIYPSLDYTMSTESYDKYGTGYLLEKAKMAWYFENYFQNNEDRKAKSPLHGNFYSAMPDTLVVVAEYDPLIDEAKLYAENVITADAKCQLVTVPGVIHGFFLLQNLCNDVCNETYKKISDFLI